MNRKLYDLIVVLVLASLAVGACTPAQPAATAMPPEATQPASGSPGATQGASCAPADPNFNPAAADIGSKFITIAMEQEPDTAFALFSNMSFAAWISQMYAGGLGKWDDKNNFIPELATEIPSADNGGVSADGLTVTWKLKPCVFWSDGTPVHVQGYRLHLEGRSGSGQCADQPLRLRQDCHH